METEMKLEDRFGAIDEILAEMEKEDVTLERSFELYQLGLEQVKAANEAITDIEKKLLVVNGEGELEEF